MTRHDESRKNAEKILETCHIALWRWDPENVKEDNKKKHSCGQYTVFSDYKLNEGDGEIALHVHHHLYLLSSRWELQTTHQCCAVCSDGYRIGRLRCHTTPWVSPSNDVIPHILQHRIQQLLQVAPNMQLVGVVKRDSTRPPLLSILTHLQLYQSQSKTIILSGANDPQHEGQEMLSNKFGRFARNHRSNQASFQGIFMALPSSPSSASTHVHSFTEEWTKEVDSNISNFVRESIKKVIFPTFVLSVCLHTNSKFEPSRSTDPKKMKNLSLASNTIMSYFCWEAARSFKYPPKKIFHPILFPSDW